MRKKFLSFILALSVAVTCFSGLTLTGYAAATTNAEAFTIKPTAEPVKTGTTVTGSNITFSITPTSDCDTTKSIYLIVLSDAAYTQAAEDGATGSDGELLDSDVDAAFPDQNTDVDTSAGIYVVKTWSSTEVANAVNNNTPLTVTAENVPVSAKYHTLAWSEAIGRTALNDLAEVTIDANGEIDDGLTAATVTFNGWADSFNGVYDGSTHTADVAVTAGATTTLTPVTDYTVTYNPATVQNAGDYTVTVALTDAAKATYKLSGDTSTTLTISKKTLTITTPTGVTKEYDGGTGVTIGTDKHTFAVTDLSASDSVTLGGTATASYADKNVNTSGHKTITVDKSAITLSDSTNYKLPDSITFEGDITAKPLNITAIEGITTTVDASATVDKPETGTADQSKFTSVDLIDGDKVTISYTATFDKADLASTGTKTLKSLTFTITGGDDKDNYSVGTASGSGIVTAGTITAAIKDASKEKYYGVEKTLTAADFDFKDSNDSAMTAPAGLTFTCEGQSAAAVLGEYTITITDPSGTYTVNTDSKLKVVACPTLTVAEPKSGLLYKNAAYANSDLVDADSIKIYANPNGATEATGLAELTVDTTKTSYGTEQSATNVGSYTVTVTAASTDANYKDSSVDVTASINKATLDEIAVTTDPTTMTYTVGDSFASDGAVVTGTFNKDKTDYKYTAPVNATVTYPTAALTIDDNGKNVTFSYSVPATDANVAATTADLTASSTGTLTINLKAQTLKPQIAAENAETEGGNGKLTIKPDANDTSANPALEYRKVAGEGETENEWTAVPALDAEGKAVLELPAGTYEARYAATSETKAGESVQAEIEDFVATTDTENAPAVAKVNNPTSIGGKGSLDVEGDAGKTVIWSTDKDNFDESAEGVTLGEDGKANIPSLDPGTYYVKYKNTDAVTYTKVSDPAEITAVKALTIKAEATENGTYTYSVNGVSKTISTAEGTTNNVVSGTKVSVIAEPESTSYSKVSVDASYEYVDENGNNKTASVPVTEVNDGVNDYAYEFTMPEYDVTLSVTFKKKSSGGGGGGGTTVYTVKYNAGTNGTITSGEASEKVASGASPAAVPEITAKDGYVFKGWSLDGTTAVEPTEQKITKATTFNALYEEAGAATPTPAPSTGDEPAADTDAHKQYISGYEDGTFRADDTITRAEAATIFARALTDYDENSSYANVYPDVDSSEWFANYVAYLSNTGIITGYEDGTFRPQQNITRQEFATMLSKLGTVLEAGEMPFTDVSDANWGIDYIYTAYANGWVAGYEDNTFRPDNNITRAEAVRMVNVYLGRGTDAAGLEGVDYTVFPDVDSSHWAYYEIIEAANDHTFEKDTMPENWVE